jgi:hypothetical protein
VLLTDVYKLNFTMQEKASLPYHYLKGTGKKMMEEHGQGWLWHTQVTRPAKNMFSGRKPYFFLRIARPPVMRYIIE